MKKCRFAMASDEEVRCEAQFQMWLVPGPVSRPKGKAFPVCYPIRARNDRSRKAGPSGKGWCPRRDSNPRPQDSYHFGFRRRLSAFVVWTVPSP